MLEADDEIFYPKKSNRRYNLISAWWFLEFPGRGTHSAGSQCLAINSKF